MATIKQIAQRAGYSQATVSRILSGDASFSVKESTRRKVLKISEELGYGAQIRRVTIPQRIAVLNNMMPDRGLQDVYFDELREALDRTADEQRMTLVYFSDVNTLMNEGARFGGFVSIGPAALGADKLRKLHRILPHGVFVDINPAPNLFDSVQPDLSQAVLDALDALVEAGYSSIGFIGGAGRIMGLRQYPEELRTLAFRDWAARLGVEGPVYADGPFTVGNGRAQGERLLKEHGRDLPQALVVAADSLAVGVLQALTAGGVLVPRDLKMVSINNQEIVRYTSPPLSSYDIDKAELARTAILLLADGMSGRRTVRQHVYISMPLEVRDSFWPGEDKIDRRAKVVR